MRAGAQDIVGNVDSFSLSKGISGWALDRAQPLEPQTLSLRLGAQEIARTTTAMIREDVDALEGVVTSGVGFYHVGVEQKWWEGPQGCTGFDISNMNTDQLLDAINAAPLVRCDEISWALAGVSMAGWNAIFSLVLFGLWIAALLKGRGAAPS